LEGRSGDGLSRVDQLALADKFPETGHRSFPAKDRWPVFILYGVR
jgi:hypothetical protein